jgi:hypothetical protein
MARKLRAEYPGAIYHVLSRGDRREPIVKDRADRLQFLETLEKLVWERWAVACVLHWRQENVEQGRQ